MPTVLDPMGVPYEADTPEQLNQALAAGYTVENPEAAAARQEAAQYGTVTEALKHAGERAVSGATLGLSDVGASALLGDEYRAARARRERLFPTIGIGAELAGSVAPLLLSGGTGGAGVAARVAGAPVRAAAEVGRVAEVGVGLGLGKLGVAGESIAGRAFLRGTQLATSGAIEGAAYGAGHELSEAALAPGGDYDHLAERVWAGARGGALFGALTGGGLGAIGGAAGGVAKRFARSEKAGEIAAESAVRALDPSKRASRELQLTGRMKETGQELLDQDIVKALRSDEDMLARASAVKRQKGDEIGALLRTADETGIGVDGKALFKDLDEIIGKRRESLSGKHRAVADAIEAELEPLRTAASGPTGVFRREATHEPQALTQRDLQELRAVSDARGKAGAKQNIGDYADELWAAEKKRVGRGKLVPVGGKLTHEQLHKARRAIDESINWAKAERSAATSDLVDVRRTIEKHLEASADKALSGSFKEQYRAAKRGYGAASWAEKQLSDNLARGQTNRIFGLSENVWGSGGMMAGALTGSMGVGALTGLATTLGHKVVRTYGHGVVATLLDRVVKAERRMNTSVSRYFRTAGNVRRGLVAESSAELAEHDTRAGRALRQRASEPMVTAYRRKVKDLAKYQGDPVGYMETKLGRSAAHMPMTAQSLGALVTRGNAFLLTKAPGLPDERVVYPGRQIEPDPVSLEQFSRYVQAVEDPLSVLDELEQGTLAPEHVEALEAVHPKLYEDIRSRVLDELADRNERGQEVDYDQRVELGILLNAPTDESLLPEHVQAYQSLYEEPLEPPQAPRAASSKPFSTARRVASRLDALESGAMEI